MQAGLAKRRLMLRDISCSQVCSPPTTMFRVVLGEHAEVCELAAWQQWMAEAPRLKAMLEHGEGKNLPPEKSTAQRALSFGRYLSNLIHGTRQVSAEDEDLEKVYDLGMAEIGRQGREHRRHS